MENRRGVGSSGLRKPFVFFDLGETIVDLTDTIRVLSRLVAEEYPLAAAGAPAIAKDWFWKLAKSLPRDEAGPFETQHAVGSRVLAEVCVAHGMPVDAVAAGRLLRRSWKEWQEHARLCEGVTVGWLREIRTLSAGVGAVTDGDNEDVRALLEKTGLRPYFDSVTTSERARAYKPNPRIYRMALDSLGAPADRSLFVSDSLLDLRGATDVGIGCAWLPRGFERQTDVLPDPTLKLEHPEDLNGVLRRFAKSGRFELG